MTLKNEDIKDIEPLNWWESKRLFYNLALLIGVFLAYLITSTSTQEFSIVESIIWIAGANIFYTMSWSFELLFFKIFRKYPFNKTMRKTIFVIGSLFSIWWININLQ